MKQNLIVIILMLTLGTTLQSIAQTHRHHPTTTVDADTTQQDGIDAFSDTTSTVSLDSVVQTTHSRSWNVKVNGVSVPDSWVAELFDNVDSDSITGMLFAIIALVIMFVISPIFIIGIVLYFVYKNRKQRMRLAETAMKNGQPIPDELVSNQSSDTKDLRQQGIRQTCLGVGLMIFLGNTAGNIGLGIGALVTCIGIGNLLIARTQKKNDELNRDLNEHDFNK